MKPISFLFLFVGLVGFASAQTEKQAYEAWLDSIKNEQYIAMDLMLDELVLSSLNKDQSKYQQYRKYNMRNTDDFVNNLLGVHMMRRGNFANEPLLRGLASDRYIISVDGMRIFGACTDKMDPVSSYIEPVNLQGLDVSFGSAGNTSGLSTGGAVDFQLKRPVYNSDKPFMASLSSGFSSVSRGFDQSFDLNFSKNKVAYRFSGVHRKAANYINGEGLKVDYSQYEKFNYAASIHYRLSSTSKLAIDFLGDDAWDVGYPALPMDVGSAKARLFAVTYYMNSFRIFMDPEFKVYHNYINHMMDDTKRDSVAMHMDMPGFTETTGTYFKAQLIESEKQKLNFRIDGFRSFARAEMTMYPNDETFREMFMLTWPDIHRLAAGVQMDYDLSFLPKWELNVGMRSEFTQSYISSQFGEQQLSIFNKSGETPLNKWLNNLSVKTTRRHRTDVSTTWSVAFSERLPSISEQFGFYLFNVHDGYDYLGDPDLKTERNLHLETSHKRTNGSSSFTVNLFGYFFSNYIMGIYDAGLSAMTIGSKGVKWYRNTPSATMFGGEVASTKEFSELSSLITEVNVVYGADFEGEPLPQMPPLKMKLSWLQKIGDWTIYPEVEWNATQKRISEKFQELSTDSYMLANLKLTKVWKGTKQKSSMNMGIENIFDEAYREHFDVGQVLRPGRSFYLQWKIIL
ncbi:MAG: TonB-dependent receptor [Cytophagales bacterium]|nr:TonB-dependent receptor [Cytophagales bacterium]